MNMTPEACQFSMKLLLQQQAELTRQLSAMLDREYAAVTARDFDAFEQVVQEKSLTVEQLDLLEQERIALIESAGYREQPDAMGSFLTWCDPGQTLTPQWEQLLALAGTCRDHNRRNHQLIELCSRHTRETLRILRGEEAQPELYQPDGETDSGHDNRPLARV